MSVIASARVPIVKFVHAATSIQVDVSFDMTSGLESGAAAKELMSNMQQVLRRRGVRRRTSLELLCVTVNIAMLAMPTL